MFPLFYIIILTGFILLILKYATNYWKPKNPLVGKVLPGPSFWEGVGGLMTHKDDLHKLFMNWRSKYGHFFAYNFGPVQLVILNDYKMIKEGFANPNLQGRAEIAPINPYRLPKSGIIRNEGKPFDHSKKIALSHLRRFDFGRGGQMEALVVDEIEGLCQHLEWTQGTPQAIRDKFFYYNMNAVWIIVAGFRLQNSPEDQRTKEMFDNFFLGIKEAVTNPLTILIPNFVDVFPWIPSWRAHQRGSLRLRDYLRKIVDDHKAALIQNEPPRDFVDAFLKENCLVSSNSSSLQFDPQAEKELEAILFDLVISAFETTNTQFEWVLYNLVINQDCQKKVQGELDAVIGSRMPTLEDRPNLPYTEACILESLRMTPAIPIGVFHTCTADTLVAGYGIKKGATVISNIYGAMHDPEFISNPESFHPQRFLSEDKSHVVNQPYLVPFSTGARSCLGFNVAKDTLFLYTASILSRFNVNYSHQLEEKGTGGMLLASPQFFASFTSRS